MSTNKQVLFLVGVPTNGEHSHYFTQHLLGTQWPTNFTMNYRAVPGYEVGDARNILVQEAINLGAKYLFMIDEDVIGPANGIRRLFYHLENHPDWSVAAGLYCTKTYPPEPLIFQEWGMGPSWDWKLGDLMKVKSTGNGFNLYRVDDMAKMKGPDTYVIRNPWNGIAQEVRRWFKTGKEYALDKNGVMSLTAHTEDSWFYSMCEEEGLQVWIDTSVQCQHYDKHNKLFFSVPMDNDVAKKPDPWNHEPRVINLGAGMDYSPYELNVDLRDEPHIHYRCDIRKLPDNWENCFDVVKANHVLEHFPYRQTDEILREWYRILKPGGTIRLNVPDMQEIGKYLAEGDIDILVNGIIWGDQGHEFWQQDPYGGYSDNGRFLPHSFQHNCHLSGFTPKYLGKLLQRAGFVNVNGAREPGMNLHIEGTKPDEGDNSRERAESTEDSPSTTPE